jgi:tetratricopeptide (TPR) repeat protein
MTDLSVHDRESAVLERAPAPTEKVPGVKELEDRAWQLFNEGNNDGAIQAFDKALALEPNSEGALQGKVAALRKKRDFPRAARLLAQAIDAHPTSIGILSERAWLHYERREYAEALKAFDEVLKVAPKNDDKIVWKSSLLRVMRKFDESESILREAETAIPDSPAIHTERGWLHFDQHQYERAEEIFAAVLKKEPGYELAVQGQTASLRMRGNFGDAKRILQDALRERPDSPGLRSEQGWLYFEEGEYERAEESFRRVLEYQPYDVFSLVNLAWSLVWQGGEKELEEAAMVCRRALQFDADLAQAYGCLGVIAAKQGRLREAESNLLRSIRLDPIRGRRSDLGALYIQMGQYKEAEDVLREAITINHDDTHARLELGNVLLLTDRVKDAIREFRSARAVDPRHPDPSRALAIALLETGQLVEAEKVLRESLRSLDQSKRWRLHLALCQVLTRVGDETGEPSFYSDALREASAAIRSNDTRAEPYFYTGVVRYKLGDYAGALRDFLRCTKRDERHLEADMNARRIQALMRSEARTRIGRTESVGLAVTFLLIMAFIFVLFLKAKISEPAMAGIVIPLLLLVLASILLPWLSKLKLKGLEADLSVPKPKETLTSGPKGEVGFDSVLASMVGR